VHNEPNINIFKSDAVKMTANMVEHGFFKLVEKEKKKKKKRKKKM
jgi:hypothetical protein